MALMLARHFFRLGGLNQQPIGWIVLGGLLISLLIQITFLLQSALLEQEIRNHPGLKAALDNELVQAITLESWRAAHLGAAGMTLVVAVTWYFYPLCDPVTISLCSIAKGTGAHRMDFYLRYKNACVKSRSRTT